MTHFCLLAPAVVLKGRDLWAFALGELSPVLGSAAATVELLNDVRVYFWGGFLSKVTAGVIFLGAKRNRTGVRGRLAQGCLRVR